MQNCHSSCKYEWFEVRVSPLCKFGASGRLPPACSWLPVILQSYPMCRHLSFSELSLVLGSSQQRVTSHGDRVLCGCRRCIATFMPPNTALPQFILLRALQPFFCQPQKPSCSLFMKSQRKEFELDLSCCPQDKGLPHRPSPA